DRAREAQVSFYPHAQSGDDVTCLERRRKSMTRRVRHSDAERLWVEGKVVVEVAANLVSRAAEGRELELAERRRCRGKQAGLDGARLLESVLERASPELVLDGVLDRRGQGHGLVDAPLAAPREP